jgi:Ca2+-binding EF-hand superfamily protein
MDGDGRLSRKEVVEVLKAQLPIDYRRLEQESKDGSLWRMWDSNGDGFLQQSELLGDQGLLSYVRSVFAQTTFQAAPPDIKTNRMAWFRHFDEDFSGTLEQGEVIRALIKTLSLTPQQQDAVCECITAIWPIFDTDGSGSIEQNEFLLPCNGLADTIIAQLGLTAG